MSSLDAILIIVTVGCAVATAAAPRIAMFALSIVAPLLLFGWFGQVLLEGFTWQFALIYLSAPVSGAVAVMLGIQPRAGRRAALARGGVAVMAVVSLLPLSVPPVPELPEPSGRYAVGSDVLLWVDSQRAEPPGPAGRLDIVAQAWFPAADVSPRQHLYTDGDRLRHVTGIPGLLRTGYGRVDTHAFAQVGVHPDREKWPVVIFSPGYRAPRDAYTALLTDLASRGFVVVAVDHPRNGDSAEAASSDTRPFCAETTADGDPADDAAMAARQAGRAADLRVVVDRLSDPDVDSVLAGRIDVEHIAAVGHCLGGASVLAALAADSRIDAAVDIDGAPYGDLSGLALTRPVLLLESDHERTGHAQRYLDVNRAVFGDLAAPGHRYELGGAGHDSFTDAPFFIAASVRAVVDGIGGRRDPADTLRTTNALIASFLSASLGGPPADLATTAAAHADVTGGPVGPR